MTHVPLTDGGRGSRVIAAVLWASSSRLDVCINRAESRRPRNRSRPVGILNSATCAGKIASIISSASSRLPVEMRLETQSPMRCTRKFSRTPLWKSQWMATTNILFSSRGPARRCTA